MAFIDGGNELYDGKINSVYYFGCGRVASDDGEESYDEEDLDNPNNLGYYGFRSPRLPPMTQICKQIRAETLSIWFGVNKFWVKDMYMPQRHGVKTPFPKVLIDWLNSISPHVSLFSHVEIDCWPTGPQSAHEIIAALTDYGFAFRAGALRIGQWAKEDNARAVARAT